MPKWLGYLCPPNLKREKNQNAEIHLEQQAVVYPWFIAYNQQFARK